MRSTLTCSLVLLLSRSCCIVFVSLLLLSHYCNFRFNGINLDPLTEMYGLSFYLQVPTLSILEPTLKLFCNQLWNNPILFKSTWLDGLSTSKWRSLLPGTWWGISWANRRGSMRTGTDMLQRWVLNQHETTATTKKRPKRQNNKEERDDNSNKTTLTRQWNWQMDNNYEKLYKTSRCMICKSMNILFQVTVGPEHRRLGLANRLMEGLEEISDGKNCYFVDLFVRW